MRYHWGSVMPTSVRRKTVSLTGLLSRIHTVPYTGWWMATDSGRRVASMAVAPCAIYLEKVEQGGRGQQTVLFDRSPGTGFRHVEQTRPTFDDVLVGEYLWCVHSCTAVLATLTCTRRL